MPNLYLDYLFKLRKSPLLKPLRTLTQKNSTLRTLVKNYSSTSRLEKKEEASLSSSNTVIDAATAMPAVPLSWIDTTSWIPKPARPYLHLARVDKQVLPVRVGVGARVKGRIKVRDWDGISVWVR
jgi:hypothetical protein